jgi:putative DNA methylase
MFSGRGILPLEAARAGAAALGLDLSPVATLAGRLLADYPLTDWRSEPKLPYAPVALVSDDDDGGQTDFGSDSSQFDADYVDEPRLVSDVRLVLGEVGRRVGDRVQDLYPGNPDLAGALPWAYLWAVTIPCDGCGRRFPLIGSMVLRHPYSRVNDLGQSLSLAFDGDSWRTEVREGVPTQDATLTAPAGKRVKAARCPYPRCGHPHNLDVIKAKGFANQYDDALLAVAEIDRDTNQKVFRAPRPDEVAAASEAHPDSLPSIGGFPALPDEVIPPGNKDNVRASGYGYKTYGAIMNRRQAVLFGTTAAVINDLFQELSAIVSHDYARALTGYAASNIIRQMKHCTRGASLRAHGRSDGTEQNRCQIDHIFSSQSVVKHQFDYLEASPGSGPGTWTSVGASLVNALSKVIDETPQGSAPPRFRRQSAIALPFRDQTVDAIVTDPPYYDMIAYSDSSDIFYVWIRRALSDAMPDLFDVSIADSFGLQDKTDEIIVKGRGAKGAGDHRSDEARYERLLALSFGEARRVLKQNGQLTIIFGHSDPEAWQRLLAALTEAGFIVTSSWPSRTERANTGVATISVTVSIGARVAPVNRPIGIAAQVDAEVATHVTERCAVWDQEGLALDDQLMASYGAACQVVGRYSKVISPDGRSIGLEHYMTLARRAVRDAIAFRVDEIPLDTFDPRTRFAIFWHEVHGRVDVPKGEARFFAQSDNLKIEDLRGPILTESKRGFRLRHDAPSRITAGSSAYEVVRGLAAAWSSGSEATAACLAAADRPPTDTHVWALVDWLAIKLPSSDDMAKALAAIKRNRSSIQAGVAVLSANEVANHQYSLFEEAAQ